MKNLVARQVIITALVLVIFFVTLINSGHVDDAITSAAGITWVFVIAAVAIIALTGPACLVFTATAFIAHSAVTASYDSIIAAPLFFVGMFVATAAADEHSLSKLKVYGSYFAQFLAIFLPMLYTMKQ